MIYCIIYSTAEGDLCKRFEVKGYPTFYFMMGDKVWKYQGVRTKAGWEDFAYEGYEKAECKAFPRAAKNIDL
jgi:hypothetical protein